MQNNYHKIPIIGDYYFELIATVAPPIKVYDICGNFYRDYDGMFRILAYENLVHFFLFLVNPENREDDFIIKYKILTNSLDQDYDEMTQAFIDTFAITENPFDSSELKYEIVLNLKRNYVTKWLCDKFNVSEETQ